MEFTKYFSNQKFIVILQLLFDSDFNKIANATDIIHSINVTANEIKPRIFNVKRKISNNNYNLTDTDTNQFTNAFEIKQNISNLTMIDVKFRLFVANVSLCAENHQTFCTKNDDYPLEYIQKLLYKLPPEYERFFYPQEVSRSSKPPEEGPEVEKNAGGGVVGIPYHEDQYDEAESDDPIEMCDTYKKVIYPTSGTTQAGDGLFIFNTDDHKQGVHIEMCQNAGKSCDDFVILRNNYRSECKQQKIYRELLSLSPEGKPTTERFEFPASCTCVLRRVTKRFEPKLLGV